MAKAAGEEMVKDMNRYLPGIHILATRLPRLATDQTTGVLPEKHPNSIDIMLPIVRNMARTILIGTHEAKVNEA